MENCFCSSNKPYEQCCEPFIKYNDKPLTAEALMRSRYCAYVVGAIDYLGQTLHPRSRDDFDRNATNTWAKKSTWLGLKILKVEGGQQNDTIGFIEFTAKYKEEDELKVHQEISQFKKYKGDWFYVDGNIPKPITQRNKEPKIGRNSICSCGSGKKYKKCCGA
tara:strand:- start:714 stop:1202 length:489 start_codon:yes stop_codon:yes gene_type:complete